MTLIKLIELPINHFESVIKCGLPVGFVGRWRDNQPTGAAQVLESVLDLSIDLP